MISNIDLTTTNADVMAMELDTIVLYQLNAGEALGVEITVYDGDTTTELDSWFNTYYADNNGNITFPDMARVWNSYILYRRRASGEEDAGPSTLMGGIKVKIQLTEEDDTVTTIYRRVWYESKDDGMTVATLNNRLPFVSPTKRTFTGAIERVYVAGPTTKTVTVVATYVSGTTASTTTFTVASSASSAFGYYHDVSPSVIASHIPSGATLVMYVVTVGSYSCTYTMEGGNYAQQTQFFYLNRWGAYESLWCVGSEKWNVERSAEYGFCGDDWSALDIDVNDTFEVSTGYVNDAVLEQLRDLAQSPSVWIYKNLWLKVAIDEVKFERVKPSNQARTATIKYEYAKRNI